MTVHSRRSDCNRDCNPAFMFGVAAFLICNIFRCQFSEVADVAEKIKTIGNEQFKLGKYEVALKKYLKALRWAIN